MAGMTGPSYGHGHNVSKYVGTNYISRLVHITDDKYGESKKMQ